MPAETIISLDEARNVLPALLTRALAGEAIYIADGAQRVRLTPAPVVPVSALEKVLRELPPVAPVVDPAIARIQASPEFEELLLSGPVASEEDLAWLEAKRAHLDRWNEA